MWILQYEGKKGLRTRRYKTCLKAQERLTQLRKCNSDGYISKSLNKAYHGYHNRTT